MNESMTDYTKLIEDLKRGFGHWYVEDWSRLVTMYADAAAAIEQLIKERDEWKEATMRLLKQEVTR